MVLRENCEGVCTLHVEAVLSSVSTGHTRVGREGEREGVADNTLRNSQGVRGGRKGREGGEEPRAAA